MCGHVHPAVAVTVGPGGSTEKKSTSSVVNVVQDSTRQQDLVSSTTSEAEPRSESSAVFERDRDRPSFGGRLLTDEANVFSQNAWDHVEMTEEDRQRALAKIAEHAQNAVDPAVRDDVVANAPQYWDQFYTTNQEKFFKERQWLPIEFPELFAPPQGRTAANIADDLTDLPFTIMEVGCGAGGATVFPLLKEWRKLADAETPPGEPAADPNLLIHACDFSSVAVQHLKTLDEFDPKHINAFVYDLASPDIPESVAAESVDIVVLIFIFSALPPPKWKQAMENVYKILKPGGLVLLRDYARLDLAQVRMKKGRLLEENLYMRGDKTMVYFFTTDEIRELAEQQGFEITQLGLDQRLLVNRGKQLRMNRNWLQCKLRKPHVVGTVSRSE
ncbi:S-adenosyl-L-methionine-dependent methyltransferase [Catenaria anguillulae PL171]|uniref:tRNA N(3)-methylcytidine methyltransferase n=1 Tax=Catenaria anguillulae PL171 TaxID=765915 RepID=A0A1Y2HBB4_9FUNG|nr:S-adenosyl-L-methionine-dependent methyltransferase [Catenaria anguillulae PL171]